MNLTHDDRIVLTLDAGGTNFVFSAVQGGKEIISSVTLPAHGDNLNKSLENIIKGFQTVKDQLPANPAAISFAFPGPSEYPEGVIGDLANLTAFRGGIALGPMLEEKFNIPVFINNDGDLFAYGEAIDGFLPAINKKLENYGSPKRYNNLMGITLGTGFGGGIVRKGELYIGDNSAGGEIWLMRNRKYPDCFAEEGASIRAIIRVYKELTPESPDNLTPKDVFEIADGKQDGNQQAAKLAFQQLGMVVGDALANALTLLDGLVVIGGGLIGAADFILPAIIDELNSTIQTMNGELLSRMEVKAFNLENNKHLTDFLEGQKREIQIPMTDKKMVYDPLKRIGIGLSQLGTSQAVSIGAYAFALNKLDKM
jgi:glucokinase